MSHKVLILAAQRHHLKAISRRWPMKNACRWFDKIDECMLDLINRHTAFGKYFRGTDMETAYWRYWGKSVVALPPTKETYSGWHLLAWHCLDEDEYYEAKDCWAPWLASVAGRYGKIVSPNAVLDGIRNFGGLEAGGIEAQKLGSMKSKPCFLCRPACLCDLGRNQSKPTIAPRKT